MLTAMAFGIRDDCVCALARYTNNWHNYDPQATEDIRVLRGVRMSTKWGWILTESRQATKAVGVCLSQMTEASWLLGPSTTGMEDAVAKCGYMHGMEAVGFKGKWKLTERDADSAVLVSLSS